MERNCVGEHAERDDERSLRSVGKRSERRLGRRSIRDHPSVEWHHMDHRPERDSEKHDGHTNGELQNVRRAHDPVSFKKRARDSLVTSARRRAT